MNTKIIEVFFILSLFVEILFFYDTFILLFYLHTSKIERLKWVLFFTQLKNYIVGQTTLL